MAYTTTQQIIPLGPGTFELWIFDTDAANTSEYAIPVDGIPAAGWVLKQVFDKGTGDAATVAPQLGLVPGATLQNQIVCAATAATGDTNIAGVPIPYHSTGGFLYHRPTPASGVNNVVTTVYTLTNDMAAR